MSSLDLNAIFNPAQREDLAHMTLQAANGAYCWISWDEPTHDPRLSVMFKRGDMRTRKVFTEVQQALALGYEYDMVYAMIQVTGVRLYEHALDTDLVRYLRDKLRPRDNSHVFAEPGADAADYLVVPLMKVNNAMSELADLLQYCKHEHRLGASRNGRRGAVSE